MLVRGCVMEMAWRGLRGGSDSHEEDHRKKKDTIREGEGVGGTFEKEMEKVFF